MIHIEHLSKKFGDLEVLKDINLDVNEGEVVCIIGPSGSREKYISPMHQSAVGSHQRCY